MGATIFMPNPTTKFFLNYFDGLSISRKQQIEKNDNYRQLFCPKMSISGQRPSIIISMTPEDRINPANRMDCGRNCRRSNGVCA
jgi:hypothetical protein